jgi:hypothetical protein
VIVISDMTDLGSFTDAYVRTEHMDVGTALKAMNGGTLSTINHQVCIALMLECCQEIQQQLMNE